MGTELRRSVGVMFRALALAGFAFALPRLAGAVIAAGATVIAAAAMLVVAGSAAAGSVIVAVTVRHRTLIRSAVDGQDQLGCRPCVVQRIMGLPVG